MNNEVDNLTLSQNKNPHLFSGSTKCNGHSINDVICVGNSYDFIALRSTNPNLHFVVGCSSKELINENNILKVENEKLKKQLESYNNSRKSYYEKNKETVNEKAKERLKKISQENPDKIKEYAKRAYQKRKEKNIKQILENNNDI